MGKLNDLKPGTRFGRLTIIKRTENYVSPKGVKASSWLCQCACGQYCIVVGSKLRSGHTQSCGCMQRDRACECSTKYEHTDHPLYGVWRHIIERCENPRGNSYKNYGGRGIAICTEWRSDFEAFYNWAISSGYTPGLSIDRIDVNGPYSPENCRFATRIQQGRNKRTNRLLEYRGEIKTLSEWAEIMGIPMPTLWARLTKYGWPIERALTEPVKHSKRK